MGGIGGGTDVDIGGDFGGSIGGGGGGRETGDMGELSLGEE